MTWSSADKKQTGRLAAAAILTKRSGLFTSSVRAEQLQPAAEITADMSNLQSLQSTILFSLCLKYSLHLRCCCWVFFKLHFPLLGNHALTKETVHFHSRWRQLHWHIASDLVELLKLFNVIRLTLIVLPVLCRHTSPPVSFCISNSQLSCWSWKKDRK